MWWFCVFRTTLLTFCDKSSGISRCRGELWYYFLINKRVSDPNKKLIILHFRPLAFVGYSFFPNFTCAKDKGLQVVYFSVVSWHAGVRLVAVRRWVMLCYVIEIWRCHDFKFHRGLLFPLNWKSWPYNELDRGWHRVVLRYTTLRTTLRYVCIFGQNYATELRYVIFCYVTEQQPGATKPLLHSKPGVDNLPLSQPGDPSTPS